MIKFCPHLFQLPEKITLGQAEQLIHNKSNKALAAQLNNKFKGKCCEQHPVYENTIIVNLANVNGFLTIENVCCENFKTKLNLLVQNKDPFL